MRRFSQRLALFLLNALLLTRPAAAHFIWIDVVGEGGTPTARVMFGEDAQPGEARLLAKIAGTRAWVRMADGSSVDLKLSPPVSEDQPAALAAPLPTGAEEIEAACDYGVYTRAPGGVRLQYCAKWLVPGTLKSVSSHRSKMEIVPTARDGKLGVAVLFAGQPDATAELIVLDAEAQGSEVKLDDEGRGVVKLPKSGRLALRAKHVAADESGEIDGQRYVQTWYCATLVLTGLNEAPPAEQTAADALARARNGRAIWRDFPGFTADVAVHGDDGNLDARATIDSSGVVELSGDRSTLHDWAERQLQSLVQHRMPDGEVTEGAVRFVAEGSDQGGAELGISVFA